MLPVPLLTSQISSGYERGYLVCDMCALQSAIVLWSKTTGFNSAAELVYKHYGYGMSHVWDMGLYQLQPVAAGHDLLIATRHCA